MDVVVVGSCNTDLSSYASHLPKEGETLTGYKFETGFGGKGANQCIAAVKLGAKCAMVGKLGDDIFGQNYLKNLETNNVDCSHVGIEKGVSTGAAAISVAYSGANSIIIIPGANNLLTVKDVDAAEDLIKSAKVLVCQNEIKSETSLAALKLAKEHGVKTIYNPAPAMKNLDPQLYSTADVFCPNETEAELLIGREVSSVDVAKKACKELIETKGCNSVIITLGANGAVYQGGKGEEPVYVSTISVKAVDTTGAGDSFIGSLAYFMATRPDLSIPDMIKRAGEIAAISVTKPGTQKSFPSSNDLPSHILA